VKEAESVELRERNTAEAAQRLSIFAGRSAGGFKRGKRVKNTATGRVYRSTREAARVGHTTEWIVQASCHGKNDGVWRYVGDA
jgi:hypothetical protein